MNPLVVVENTSRWRLKIPGVDVVPARTYVTDLRYSGSRGTTVFNLCRTYGYQTLGYYVSLLATARAHRPLPSVATLQDIRLPHMVRLASEDLDDQIQRSLRRLQAKSFELSIYFGRNLAKRYDPLSLALFNLFPAPLLRARFVREERWRLDRIRPIATNEVPESHTEFVIERATEYLRRRRHTPRPRQYRYDLAILVNPNEKEPPSNPQAIRKFCRAARALDFDPDLIEPEDYGRIAEFDALFIRETTYVDGHPFRFARRAAAEGLVVIDDPESIVRCGNKVFLAEAFASHGVPAPRTLIVDSDDAQTIEEQVGLPCVLKRADSSFSQGVVKAETREELRLKLPEVLANSQLAIAQEFLPSDFDWRIGMLDGQPLFACKYYMAPGHWQIIRNDTNGSQRYGRVEPIALDKVPMPALEIAKKSAGLVGSGFYGVDIKQIGNHFVVMEVNDNPNVEAGHEDALLGDELYLAVMRYFRKHLEARGQGASIP